MKTSINSERITGIVATNSISYIKTVFDTLAEERIVVPLRSEDDAERIDATGLDVIKTPDSDRGWFEFNYPQLPAQKLAQISFTSGTEGKPKGVLLSHAALNNTVERLIDISKIDASAREYVGVPVYHSFGYGRCRLLSTVGGQGFIPESGFNPLEVAQMLRNGEINALSAVPSLLRLLLTNTGIFDSEREQMKWIEIGSQPMSAEEKKSLRELFPNANIVQHYGLTEASRSSLLNIGNASMAELASVGRAYGDTEFKINNEGCIVIRGSHLASGLLIEGEITPLVDNDGWFSTSDLGHLENNFLYFDGRADNMINCGGQKISAEQIEADILAEFKLKGGIAACRSAHDIYGEIPVVFKEAETPVDSEQLKLFVEGCLKRRGINALNVLQIEEIDQLPLTDTGKVRRKELANLLADKDKNAKLDGAQANNNSPTTLRGKFEQLTGSTVSDNESIESLGLDSIQVVGLLIFVETMLGYIPSDIRKLTIAEIEVLPKHEMEAQDSAEQTQRVAGSTNENPKNISFFQLIKEDFITHESDWASQGFWAIANHRFGNWRMSVRPKLLRIPFTILYRMHLKLVQICCGIKLDYTVKLGRRVKLEHFGGMILGARSIGDEVTIRQNTTFGIKDLSNLKGKPTIEKGVNIGAGAVIVGDITIGRYSVIGPNVVVDEDVPPFSTVSNPKPTVQSN